MGFINAPIVSAQSMKLGADVIIPNTTPVKITGLDMALGIGIYTFKYFIIHQASAVTTGRGWSVNFSGTVTNFLTKESYIDTGTANLNNAQIQAGGAGNTYIGGSGQNVKSALANFGITTSVSVANTDMLTIIEGTFEVTVAGNLELYGASEVVSNITVKKNSNLVVNTI